MRTLKLTVAYDGTRFVGWQRQAEGESIQGLLETALARFEGAHVTVNGAGRTDAGVHALGQVASAQVTCGHDPATLTRGLNAALPPEIRVLAVEDAGADFHARFSARSKTYRYLLRNGGPAEPFGRCYVWTLPAAADLQAMRHAARALVGRHDFAAFRSVGTDTQSSVRTVTRSEFVAVAWPPPVLQPSSSGLAGTEPNGTVIGYEVQGDGFLRHMVRAIVGTLVEIGRGWRTAESMTALLQGGSRAQAGATAPPHGLFLVRVDYD